MASAADPATQPTADPSGVAPSVDPSGERAAHWRALSSASSSSGLPGDMVMAAARRLVLCMYAVAAANALYTVLYLTLWQEYGNWRSRGLAMLQIVGSLLLALWLRRPRSQSSVARIGVAYELGVCFLLALVEFCNAPASAVPEGRISWVCVVIVLFPALVPTRPGAMLAASFASAATTPLAYELSLSLVDYARAPAAVLWSLFIPPFVCAAISGFLALVVHRLGKEVGRARRLGSYELVDKLGAGGMGEVWRARHRLLVRPAAIKLMRASALGGTGSRVTRELLERFEREAQATALLTSPHTVELYDFGISQDGVLYYVMELLDGVDLETLVKKHGPLPPERVVWLLRQACDSLDDAHRVGLVHRDIKPANIVAARRGRHTDYVKVLDFGLVKGALAGSAEVQLTSDVQIKGTPAYLPPEAVTGETPVDARSDVYALGCVAYWLVTGQLVFDAPSPMKMAIAHATEAPRPVSVRAPGACPAELDRLILQCLSKDKAQRPSSALELSQRLAAIPFTTPWDEERAAAWWRDHVPEAAVLSEESDPGRAVTLFHPAQR
ncbi:MAG TPA: serine/threonine-protein kinase [Polyangiaceae bacterium]|nr:serine/threonine-protein kinase [Polyangiaceae bacterium]